MSATVMPLVSGGVMQKIDQTTIRQIGVPGPVLMENAGRAAFRRVIALLRRQRETGQSGGHGGVVIVAGTGNNGGDGLVVARHLLAEGIRVHVILSGSPERLSDDAALNYGILRKTGFEPRIAKPGESLVHRLRQSDLIVDGVLGTGIKGAPRGEAAELIKQINDAGRPVLSLDIPSGVEADTGQAAGLAVRAEETVTFGALKIGLVLYPGASHAGRVWVARIGIPHCVLAEQGAGLSITTFEEAASLLPYRPPDAHKGTCGRTVILGGSPGLTGAPVMAGTAAQRAGCGLTTVGVPQSLVAVIAPRLMEVMYAGLEETEDSTLSPGSLDGAENLVRSADAVVAGCGASGTSGVKKLVLRLLAETEVPL
ncbi:MAG: NAD(P)H-hydrate epimerase, partial [Gemmatimonadota bacterium]|nr:NAD(P)H-hydrate epimerase [Gemmatimonadota bacterium]